jgi:hypothetical protein
MVLALLTSINDFVHPPQAEASGRHRSRYLRQAHFIAASEKGASEPSWVGKFAMILDESSLEVNKILLG